MPCGVGKAPGGTCSRLKCVGLWPSLIQTACCRVITRQPDLQTFALQHTCLREAWESPNLTMGTTWQLGRTTERLPTASPHQLLQQRWHGNCILAHFRGGGAVMPKAMGAEKHLDTALVGMSLKDVRKAPKRPWKYRGFNS